MNRDLTYEYNNIAYNSQYPEGGIKCKNYTICDSLLPTWWFDCNGCYLCLDCLIMNTLEVKKRFKRCYQR